MVLFMLGVGMYMTGLEFSQDKLQLYGNHKSIGSIILGLMLLRLLWRLTNIQPRLPRSMESWKKASAQATHFLLYILLFAMPISGWLMSSAAGFPVSIFGWFTLPDLVNQNEQYRELLSLFHETIGYSLIGIIAIHIFAAFQHHFIYKDTILRRMLPWANIKSD